MNRPRSLARDIFAWVLGALTLVWATVIFVGYRTGQHEADELTDGHLASASTLLLAYAGGPTGRDAPIPRSAVNDLRAHDFQESLSVVIWDAQGDVLARSGDAPLAPFATPEGFATLHLGNPPREWRAFSRWSDEHDRKVMVLISGVEHDQLADDIAGQAIAPGLWVLPVIAIVLGLAIRRGLRPLYELSEEVHALDTLHGAVLPATTRPTELAAAVNAINTLVERYQGALQRERALASEFAHELRTPLASIALLARELQQASPGDAGALLERLEQDALRAGDVLSHLLALARASRAEMAEGAQPVELQALARRVVAEMAPAADRGGHELALETGSPCTVNGHAVLLELALRNIVENAVSHTPAGTHVCVRVDGERRRLDVCDDAAAPATAPGGGPALGLGLGHRVVEKIAAVHGARFDELPNPGGAGRCYRLDFGAATST